MAKILAKPEEGDVVYDPEDPQNPERYMIFHKGNWVQALDPFGNYGGPYAEMRALMADEGYRANMAEFEADKARVEGRDRAVDIVAGVMAAYEGPADKRAAAAAAALKRVRDAMAVGEGDAIKLAAQARRAIKVALKGGARRTRRAAH